MREVVLDTETTGFDPKSGHRMVEIGCVEMINHFTTDKIYHQYMNPERDMPEAAFNVHGLSEEFLSDKPLFADVADDFLAFIDGAKLIIHNAKFDVNFLNHELELVGKKLVQWDYVIDTLILARTMFPGAQNNLDALCRRFSIDNSARDYHGALLDSELLAEVYIELIGGHQSNLMFNADDNQEGGQGTKYVALTRPTPLKQRLTNDEKQAHDEFLKSEVKEALWHSLK